MQFLARAIKLYFIALGVSAFVALSAMYLFKYMWLWENAIFLFVISFLISIVIAVLQEYNERERERVVRRIMYVYSVPYYIANLIYCYPELFAKSIFDRIKIKVRVEEGAKCPQCGSADIYIDQEKGKLFCHGCGKVSDYEAQA